MPQNHTRIAERAVARLRLKHLKLLEAVHRHGSILKAARELGLSQPAATRMLQEMELDFEVQLFDRSNRGTLPTPHGEVLLAYGRRLFAQLTSAAQELEDLTEGNSGRIVVGTLLAASSVLLPLAIAEVLRTRPRLTIAVVEGTNEQLLPRLRDGELDMVVGRLAADRLRSGTDQVHLFDEKVALFVRPDHPLAGRRHLGFEELKPYGWILPPAEITLRRHIDQFFVRHDPSYRPIPQIESLCYLTNRRLLRDMDLIAVMSTQVAAGDTGGNALVQLDIRLPFGAGPVGATFREVDGLSPAALAFLAAMKEVAQGL